MAKKNSQEFVWFELKPQQRFKDDHENQILKIVQYAGEFAFFILRNKSEMRLLVRTTEKDKNLFRTIDGLTTESIDQPQFRRLVAKHLVLKNHFMVPLFDLSQLKKSDVYSKFWQESSSCMMSCFVNDQTKKISDIIHDKVNSLETRLSKKNSVFSNRMKLDLAGAKNKIGHNLYNCFIIFGVETMREISELQTTKKDHVIQEKVRFENYIQNLKPDFIGEQYKIEREKQSNIHNENIKKINDEFKLERDKLKKDIVESTKRLDKIISSVILNSFSHRIKTSKIKFINGKKTLGQKFVELFSIKSIDPNNFVPQRLGSKSLCLSDVELAFFLSFPEEKDIRIINFGVGASATFVRSPTQNPSESDLTKHNSQQTSN